MGWTCDDLDRDEWSALACDAPFEQSWAYGEIAAGFGARARRYHFVEGGRSVAIAQGIERGLGPLRCLWLPHGTHPLSGAAIRFDPVLPRGTFVMSPEAGIALGSMPARAEITLHNNMRADLSKKWRNRLTAAERAGLVIRHHGGCSEWLIAEETRQRKDRGYRALPPAWLRRLAELDARAVESWTAWKDGARVAGITCIFWGRGMRYHIGYSSPSGRACSAHNLLIWEAMRAGHARGATRLDLGFVDAKRLPGLTRFKLGTGAVEIPGPRIRLRAGARHIADRLASTAGAFHRGPSVK
ncbi:GNAT family N-acetyltransferase [Palleronia sp. LCG004]|uniref:GNAT family N-acetyltransferase n=1 Tax=Palleronia sp. LCG004 TaxID=3079304 RepID=UPI002942C573|nr:GNAT family N-acetyltransferase [Palleronia sp. LCG004]WOI57251.1 GNAT family N-acetyltransferase [Palleronia sp. LCG004]